VRSLIRSIATWEVVGHSKMRWISPNVFFNCLGRIRKRSLSESLQNRWRKSMAEGKSRKERAERTRETTPLMPLSLERTRETTPQMPLSQDPSEWTKRFHYHHGKESNSKDKRHNQSGTPSTTLALFKQLVDDHTDIVLVYESYGNEYKCEWRGGDLPIYDTEQKCRYSIYCNVCPLRSQRSCTHKR